MSYTLVSNPIIANYGNSSIPDDVDGTLHFSYLTTTIIAYYNTNFPFINGSGWTLTSTTNTLVVKDGDDNEFIYVMLSGTWTTVSGSYTTTYGKYALAKIAMANGTITYGDPSATITTSIITTGQDHYNNKQLKWTVSYEGVVRPFTINYGCHSSGFIGNLTFDTDTFYFTRTLFYKPDTLTTYTGNTDVGWIEEPHVVDTSASVPNRQTDVVSWNTDLEVTVNTYTEDFTAPSLTYTLVGHDYTITQGNTVTCNPLNVSADLTTFASISSVYSTSVQCSSIGRYTYGFQWQSTIYTDVAGNVYSKYLTVGKIGVDGSYIHYAILPISSTQTLAQLASGGSTLGLHKWLDNTHVSLTYRKYTTTSPTSNWYYGVVILHIDGSIHGTYEYAWSTGAPSAASTVTVYPIYKTDFGDDKIIALLGQFDYSNPTIYSIRVLDMTLALTYTISKDSDETTLENSRVTGFYDSTNGYVVLYSTTKIDGKHRFRSVNLDYPSTGSFNWIKDDLSSSWYALYTDGSNIYMSDGYALTRIGTIYSWGISGSATFNGTDHIVSISGTQIYAYWKTPHTGNFWVEDTTPADDATGVSPTAPIFITFNLKPKESTLLSSYLKVCLGTSSGTAMDWFLCYVDDVDIMIKTVQSFPYNALITVTLDSNIKSDVDNYDLEAYEFSFTTAGPTTPAVPGGSPGIPNTAAGLTLFGEPGKGVLFYTRIEPGQYQEFDVEKFNAG